MSEAAEQRAENARIKAGEVAEDRPENKRQRKDVDARLDRRKRQALLRIQEPRPVDVKRKLIRSYAVTDAALHDSNVFEQLLADNTSRDVWADSAYRSAERLECLAQDGFREHIQRKGSRNSPLTPREQEGNKTRSRIRSRVEHVFGVQAQRAGNLLLRTIGIARARAKIGSRNLGTTLTGWGCFWRQTGEVRPGSGKMAKERHRAQSEVREGVKPTGLKVREHDLRQKICR